MNGKKELCRNFQRGSCQYGARCKFLHSAQQQSKTNVFGFGTQSGSSFQPQNLQQQKPNPFGFGVQNNSSQSMGRPADYGSRQNQSKPFENKWNRNGTTGNSASRQPDNQSQAANHKCTDSESCKRVIIEDFEHERPLWKLTCYGHQKNGPCDISGDISSEELRAAAYDDVKRGLSLQSIVERERSILNAKLIEFDNMLRNPYNIRLNSATPSGSTTFLAPSVGPSFSLQNNAPFSSPSFNLTAPLVNMGFGTSSPTPINNAFQQSNNGFQNLNQKPSEEFGTNYLQFGRTDPFSSQTPPVSTTSMHSTGIGQPQINNFINNTHKENFAGDASIWLKDKWSRGEIPEDAPPDAFI